MVKNNLTIYVNTSITITIKGKTEIKALVIYTYISLPINVYISNKKLMGNTTYYAFSSSLGYSDPNLKLKNF